MEVFSFNIGQFIETFLGEIVSLKVNDEKALKQLSSIQQQSVCACNNLFNKSSCVFLVLIFHHDLARDFAINNDYEK